MCFITSMKTHFGALKTFIRNKIVSGRRARLRLSAFLPGTWLMLHHRTRRIQAAGHRHRVLREGHEKGYRLRSYQIQGHPVVPLAACLKVFGPYDKLYDNYVELFAYLEKEGYRIVAAPRAVYIDGIWNQEDADKWLTIIQAPVEKA